MKKTLIVLFASLALTGCAETEVVEDEAVDDETEVVEVVEDEVVEDEDVEDKVEETEVELVEVEVEPAEDELTRDQRIRMVELMMTEAFEETGDVHYSIIEDALVYTPTDPQFTLEMAQMMLGTLDRSSWDGMVESFRTLSGTVSEMVDEYLGIIVMNPENDERIVLMVRDGVVEYDFMEEQ